jgi:hypothetical protein
MGVGGAHRDWIGRFLAFRFDRIHRIHSPARHRTT